MFDFVDWTPGVKRRAAGQVDGEVMALEGLIVATIDILAGEVAVPERADRTVTNDRDIGFAHSVEEFNEAGDNTYLRVRCSFPTPN
jgi:hypothetical protein